MFYSSVLVTMVLILLVMSRDLRGVPNWCRTFEPVPCDFSASQIYPVLWFSPLCIIAYLLSKKNDVQKITSILAYVFLPFLRNCIFKPRTELFHLLFAKKSK